MRWKLRPARKVYPRVCGGTAGTLSLAPAPAGLSPRVRGNRGADSPAVLVCGSIPACAGEPPWGSVGGSITRVYPRVCGGTGQRLE